MRIGAFIQTYMGIPYWPFDPRPEEVLIDDIAHALSNLCRYTGHTKKFYSVAEHSVHVSYMVHESHALEALLHDASEAYCSDLARPVKQALREYQIVEQMNDAIIRERFGLPSDETFDVKRADNDILLIEKAALLRPTLDWELRMSRAYPDIQIQGYAPESAKLRFLARFEELGGHYATT